MSGLIFSDDLYEALPNPDDIGESEYRLIHSFVEDLVSNDEDVTPDEVLASMDEIIASAQTVKNVVSSLT